MKDTTTLEGSAKLNIDSEQMQTNPYIDKAHLNENIGSQSVKNKSYVNNQPCQSADYLPQSKILTDRNENERKN